MLELWSNFRHLNRFASLASRPLLLNNFNNDPLISSKRTVFILKRRFLVKQPKYGQTNVKLKGRDYVYDLVENTENRKRPFVSVVLKKFVEGTGLEGDIVSLSRQKAYNLLVCGLADYVTPEIIEAAKSKAGSEKKEGASSPFVIYTKTKIEQTVFCIVMNKDTPWTIQPWHIRVAFRKSGVIVPEHAIKIPDKPISGPDMSLENKDFVCVITINGKEKANARCRIHHWATNASERLPYVKYPWCQKAEAIFEEDVPILEKLPLFQQPEKSVIQM